MIVDSHTHLGEFPGFNVEMSEARLLRMMDENRISHSVVFSQPNQLTADAMENHPDRITGLYWLDPTQEETYKKCMEAIADGFRGYKLHPLIDGYLPDSPVVHPVMEAASKNDVPVLFHSGHPPWSLPWHFGNLAEAYPDVEIILGHMGHGHIVYINASIEVAEKDENIYLETSGMPMHTKIKEACEKVGADRVLYGSDAPFHHQSVEILKVKVSGLDERDLEKVLGLNAIEVFNLDL